LLLQIHSQMLAAFPSFCPDALFGLPEFHDRTQVTSDSVFVFSRLENAHLVLVGLTSRI
jgi:hypothetical protein